MAAAKAVTSDAEARKGSASKAQYLQQGLTRANWAGRMLRRPKSIWQNPYQASIAINGARGGFYYAIPGYWMFAADMHRLDTKGWRVISKIVPSPLIGVVSAELDKSLRGSREPPWSP